MYVDKAQTVKLKTTNQYVLVLEDTLVTHSRAAENLLVKIFVHLTPVEMGLNVSLVMTDLDQTVQCVHAHLALEETR
jgi:hypothetical protein